MPIYEYECKKDRGGCGQRVEEMRKINDPPMSECPKCGTAALGRVFSPPGLVFKGSGFYVNDYGKNKCQMT